MAHHTTHRRNLAAPDTKTSMDPTPKKQPKSTPFTTATTATKPHQDPTIASSTIHNISKHFSKLYPNHHKVLPSSKSSNPPSKQPPTIDTQFQSKSLSISAIEDASFKSVTKSSHLRRKSAADTEKEKLRSSISGAIDCKSPKEFHEALDIKESVASGKTDKVKRLSRKGRAKKESHEGLDIKLAFQSLSRSQEFVKAKGGDEGGNDVKRPSFSLAMSGGRRRSFCNSQAELGDFFSCNGVKVVSVDMPPFMQVHAVDCARKAYDSLEKFTSKSLALSLKKEFDGVYGPAWHCIVGNSFGSFVTHSVGGFLYFSMDHKMYILLFKTTVQRAD